jgi:hypothetical protein
MPFFFSNPVLCCAVLCCAECEVGTWGWGGIAQHCHGETSFVPSFVVILLVTLAHLTSLFVHDPSRRNYLLECEGAGDQRGRMRAN